MIFNIVCIKRNSNPPLPPHKENNNTWIITTATTDLNSYKSDGTDRTISPLLHLNPHVYLKLKKNLSSADTFYYSSYHSSSLSTNPDLPSSSFHDMPSPLHVPQWVHTTRPRYGRTVHQGRGTIGRIYV